MAQCLKNFVVALFIVSVVLGCYREKKVMIMDKETQSKEPLQSKETISEIFSRLNPNDTIQSLDLSRQNLKSLPDLSNFKIVHLNLSFNQLDTIPLNHLPRNLRKLICTNNRLRNFTSSNYMGQVNKYHNSALDLYEVDLSYNNLQTFKYTVHHKRTFTKKCDLRRVHLSNNKLSYVSINCGKMTYLDISNNTTLSNVFDFHINDIDTIVRNNIKNELPLEIKYVVPIQYPIID